MGVGLVNVTCKLTGAVGEETLPRPSVVSLTRLDVLDSSAYYRAVQS